MRDFDGFMHSLIAGLVGAVAGILFASLLLSAKGAASSRFAWDDLGSIATFWGGHLAALSILIIGVGLLIQARQLRTQIVADRSQALRSRLDHLASQLPVLATNLCAYHVDDSANPLKIETFRGLQQFSAAVLDKPHDLADIEIWTDTWSLAAYFRACREVLQIAGALKTFAEASGDAEYDFMYHRGVYEYSERMLASRAQNVVSLRNSVHDETALAGVVEMLDQGWRVEPHEFQGRHFLRARRLEPFLRRIDVLKSDGPDLQTACKLLVQEWTAQYR